MSEELKHTLRSLCPWGSLYVERRNYEGGYFATESYLVDKYLQTPSTILIIGAGNGREARPIRDDGHRIVCIDIGLLYLLSGQKLFASEDAQNISFVLADATGLPFANQCFDFVFFSLYSSLGKSRYSVMTRVRQVIRPSGFLLITTCTPLYKRLYPHPKTANWAWISNDTQLQQEVSLCGFELLESQVDPARSEYRFALVRRGAEKPQTNDPFQTT